MCPAGHQDSVSALHSAVAGSSFFPSPPLAGLGGGGHALQGGARAWGQAPSSHSLAASPWVAWGGAVAALRPGCCDSLLSFCHMDATQFLRAKCAWDWWPPGRLLTD